jgi:hypothetical protein
VGQGNVHQTDRIEPLDVAEPRLQLPPLAHVARLNNHVSSSVVDHGAGDQFNRQPALIPVANATLQRWRDVEGGDRFLQRGAYLRYVLGMNEVEEPSPDPIVALIPQHGSDRPALAQDLRVSVVENTDKDDGVFEERVADSGRIVVEGHHHGESKRHIACPVTGRGCSR